MQFQATELLYMMVQTNMLRCPPHFSVQLIDGGVIAMTNLTEMFIPCRSVGK